MVQCVNCGKDVEPDKGLCPSCGSEQPVEWMVKAVYVLAFLFVQGVVYRLVLPNADSALWYAVYFVLTSAIALCVWRYRRKKSRS